ncbi:hypothetical protein QTP70_009787 [Hemibagrus guttatus]|uniref:Uncharacterized protein n=1 Tax=Hemibagrus guttatus TaxID=175788 RepID=A0AAE0Q3F1_9TELE|nr:hypothetical protein QTP70_009787 [Hemibagrus guttatus]KAK3534137.1 hypothetical protein QTP86_002286 [Hemibagrus guttatus]
MFRGGLNPTLRWRWCVELRAPPCLNSSPPLSAWTTRYARDAVSRANALIASPMNPFILGFPLLQYHEPQFNLKERELIRWSPFCRAHCLREVLTWPCITTSIESPSTRDEVPISREYQLLQEVFSKQRAAQLPPHRPWDCAIDLLPHAMLPKCRVCPLLLPESQAMDEYIEEALAAGYIHPSTSPAATGFFFGEKKNGGLMLCID